ncbi:MAG: hypothetical protein EOM01_07260 [Spirochaetia bacterium]|nr:hypothetical protein [Spirochaetia bacterium]
MTYQLIDNGSGITDIQMGFADEGVDLNVSRKVAGDAEKALTQVKVLEADTRKDFSDLFPLPEVVIEDEGGML